MYTGFGESSIRCIELLTVTPTYLYLYLLQLPTSLFYLNPVRG
jgi:hypothetical protein